jgi:hypothetical protein
VKWLPALLCSAFQFELRCSCKLLVPLGAPRNCDQLRDLFTVSPLLLLLLTSAAAAASSSRSATAAPPAGRRGCRRVHRAPLDAASTAMFAATATNGRRRMARLASASSCVAQAASVTRSGSGSPHQAYEVAPLSSRGFSLSLAGRAGVADHAERSGFDVR